jgi:hypothetical protein
VNAEIVNRSSQALGSSVLQWANGTYTTCATHSGSWSLRIAGSTAMDNTALSVIQNDPNCVLKLTSLVTNESSKTTYTATPSMQLGGSYLGSASSFSSGSGIAFYGNVKMTPADFSSNLTVTIAYSDDPNLTTPQSLTGVYASVTATAVTNSITSPNYTLDLTTNAGSLTVVVDANYLVQSVSGTAILTAGSTAGTSYYVDSSLGASPTFAVLDGAYSGSPTSISAGNVNVAASALNLTGFTLPVTRTIVVQRLASGVAAYETFRVTFNHP